ncbi:hypothetical protein ACFYM7_34850 [Streptomyces cyaneofuscatus]
MNEAHHCGDGPSEEAVISQVRYSGSQNDGAKASPATVTNLAGV